MIKILTLDLPQYSVDQEPDHKNIGRIVDDFIREHFYQNEIVVRGISSSSHPDKTADELVEIIKKTGTDRYDKSIRGDRYENLQGKHIDLFAFRRKVTTGMQLFRHICWGFYHGSKAIHGSPVRIDILIIYDAKQLKAVAHQYEGRQDIKRDGYIFKDPTNKQASLLGIIKLT